MIRDIIYLKKLALGLFIFWVTLISIFLWNQIQQEYVQVEELALNEAIVNVKKDLAYRSWVTSHGGVYVPVTQKTPPNPYLSHVPDRDVRTLDGKILTLMNPAYALSQLMTDYSKLYGTKSHITSKKYLNPDNKPDSWESKALTIIDKTKTPYSEFLTINDQNYLRYLSPLITEDGCLKCHGQQGYKVGDVRGGISVAIPMKPFYDNTFDHMIHSLLYLIVIMILGTIIIFFGYKKIHLHLSEKILNYEQHIFSLVSMIEDRDSYTAGHTNRVAEYASMIALEMNVCEEDVEKLYRASMVHDIGKISTPDSVLLKPGRLTKLEYKLIQQHVSTGYRLLKKVDVFKDIAEIVRFHHEYYDGSGYPLGLKGDEIPLLSQIMSLADAFDAMTTDRVYKGRKTVRQALAEIELLSNKQFNGEIVKSALIALKDIEAPKSNQQPRSQIERERFSYFYRDQLTGVYNRDYLNYILIADNDNNPETAYVCINLVYLTNFSQYNRKYGWNKGNELLMNIAQQLVKSFPDALIFRIYGDDFVVLHRTHHDIETQLAEMDSVLDNTGTHYVHVHVNLEKEQISSVDDLDSWLLNY